MYIIYLSLLILPFGLFCYTEIIMSPAVYVFYVSWNFSPAVYLVAKWCEMSFFFFYLFYFSISSFIMSLFSPLICPTFHFLIYIKEFCFHFFWNLQFRGARIMIILVVGTFLLLFVDLCILFKLQK